MIQKSIACALLCYWVVSISGAQNRQESAKSIEVFTINKKPVTAEEFIYLYRKNHQNKKEEFTEAKIEEYLNLFINFKLKVAEAQKRGLDTTEAFRNEYNSYREELRKPHLPDTKLLDSLIHLTYNRMKEEIKASHILINLKPEAQPEDTLQAWNAVMDLRNKFLKGEDFGSLAATHSNDPSGKINKGNLGYFTAMQMVYPFEEAAYRTKVGEVSLPVRTRFGYHIILVTDRRPSMGEVEVSHIMLRTGEDSNNEKAKNTIFELYDQLQKGVKWEELCKEYSEDPASRENGGRLRPFGVGVMGSVPEFETMAFALDKPGDISDPFQTQFGWHIIRLERKIPLPSYEELAPSLKQRVSRDERVQVSKEALQNKMKKDLGYSENEIVKTKVMAMGDTSLQRGRWTPPQFADADKQVLFKLNTKPYFVRDFLQYAQKNQRSNALASEEYLKQLYNNFVDLSVVSAIEEKIIASSPDYKWLLQEYYEGILLFEIMEKEVWNKATEDSIGQRKYFEANASTYKAQERIAGTIYSTSSKTHIDQLKDLLQQNDSIKINEVITTGNIKQDEGAYEKDDRVILGKINWSPGIYTAENNGIHYIVKVDKILPPGPKTFEEARPEIISDYQTHLEKSWVDQLRKKYVVKINKKGKQFTIQQLLKT